MKTNKWILAGTALTGVFATHGAFAQSTASQEVEKVTEVVVTANRAVGVTKRESGVKQKATIDQSVISKDSAGQTITETLNLIPGYNFTSNDAYGSSGGNVRLRGLEGSRISLTFDGIQLNDSGNYAIYTNQQLESELICVASIQTGATDVDSMTASATGGTINYNTCKPEETMGGVLKVSVGDNDMKYGLVRLDSGRFGPFGTRAFFAYTGQSYDTWQRETSTQPGRIQKNQYNFRVFQDIGDKGSFVSLAGHYNENRNRLYFSNPMSYYLLNGYDINTAGNDRPNPSNTGNVRFQSKFVVTDKLTVTADSAFQYVLANGGGSSSVSESDARFCGTFFGTTGCGTDLNGDNDKADSIRIYSPSNTKTHRVSLTTSAIYELFEGHTLRFGASFDRANHRQTGEATLLDANGAPINVFAGKGDAGLRLKTQDGSVYRGRDRFSEADVDVLSFEYRGYFLDERLLVSLGLRNQKMERNLNQFCYTQIDGSGTVRCSTEPSTTVLTTSEGYKVVTLASQGTRQYFAPFSRSVQVEKTLPNMGLTYRLTDNSQLFVAYSESLSAPQTDNYYNVALAGSNLKLIEPQPETSETIELGYRYNTPNFNGTFTVFSAKDHDRIVRAYNEVEQRSEDRNVGEVERTGWEASWAFRPVQNLTLNGSASYIDAEVQNDLVLNSTQVLRTTGKKLVETPEWMFTGGMNYQITSRLNLNLDAKYVGDRFTTDINDQTAPHYVVWNGALRYDLPWLKQGTYLQLNARNLFDERYFTSISSRQTALGVPAGNGSVAISGSQPNVGVGAPRTVSLTLRTKF